MFSNAATARVFSTCFSAVGGWHLGGTVGRVTRGQALLPLTRPLTVEGGALSGPARRSAKGSHCISFSN